MRSRIAPPVHRLADRNLGLVVFVLMAQRGFRGCEGSRVRAEAVVPGSLDQRNL